MTVRTAIVVEGGAMRGIFSAGVLDELLQRSLSNFDLAIGTSAGACNLASFVAGQHRRNLRCYVEIMARRELFSLRRAVRGGHYMDLDWLWDRFAAEHPLDEAAITRSRTQLVSVATSARTGLPMYLPARGLHIHDELKAGCALPFLYRGPCLVGGEPVVDGGITDAIPVEEAYRRGARRIVVIRSRPAHVVKRDTLIGTALTGLLYRTPEIARAMRQTARRYQAAVAFLRTPPGDAEILELAPAVALKTTRTTQDRGVLQADYELGVVLAREHAAQIQALLSPRQPQVAGH